MPKIRDGGITGVAVWQDGVCRQYNSNRLGMNLGAGDHDTVWHHNLLLPSSPRTDPLLMQLRTGTNETNYTLGVGTSAAVWNWASSTERSRSRVQHGV